MNSGEAEAGRSRSAPLPWAGTSLSKTLRIHSRVYGTPPAPLPQVSDEKAQRGK